VLRRRKITTLVSRPIQTFCYQATSQSSDKGNRYWLTLLQWFTAFPPPRPRPQLTKHCEVLIFRLIPEPPLSLRLNHQLNHHQNLSHHDSCWFSIRIFRSHQSVTYLMTCSSEPHFFRFLFFHCISYFLCHFPTAQGTGFTFSPQGLLLSLSSVSSFPLSFPLSFCQEYLNFHLVYKPLDKFLYSLE
jgi:hypothetical protein